MLESRTFKIKAQDLLVMIYLNDVINTYQQAVDRLVPAGYMSDKSRARYVCQHTMLCHIHLQWERVIDFDRYPYLECERRQTVP